VCAGSSFLVCKLEGGRINEEVEAGTHRAVSVDARHKARASGFEVAIMSTWVGSAVFFRVRVRCLR
jgi:hypothetical protein